MNVLSPLPSLRLSGVKPKTIAELGKRGIILTGTKRGTWQRDASITGYVRHLRAEALVRSAEAGQSAREVLSGLASSTNLTKPSAL